MPEGSDHWFTSLLAGTQADLDRVDAFYQDIRRTGNGRLGCCRGLCYRYSRFGIYLLGMLVAWLLATPVLMLSTHEFGFSDDLASDQAIGNASKVALVLLWLGLVQFAAAGLMYWTNRREDEMLPRRRGNDGVHPANRRQ